MAKNKIFVQIASYRDPELQYTVQDLFKKAKRPENIFIGICHQYDIKGDEDKHLFKVEFPRKEQLRIDEVDYRDAQGCCWARNRVQKLYNGEKWTLMIDSHMRFEEGWDEIAINMANSLIKDGYKKPVISHYPPGYYYDENNNEVFDKGLCRMRPKFGNFDNGVIPDLAGPPVINYEVDFPVQTSVIGACFLFTIGKVNEEIIYDDNLYFHGEEISLSVRLWTSGYDIFCPHKIIFYHMWLTGKKASGEKFQDSNKHKKDDKDSFVKTIKTYEIVKDLLKIKYAKNRDIKYYGLGKERSLRDFERFCKIDFRGQKLRQSNIDGFFGDWMRNCDIKQVSNIFQNL